jgi:Na+/H+ antiporter NhaD/arsenite permease-like protein
VAGALKHSEVTSQIASKFIHQFGRDVHVLIPTIMVSSAIGSALVDNVIFVAAYAPIIEALQTQGVHTMPLWWALLFGACFGGNITLIGSTANIVALGMLEKNAHVHIRFLQWLKIGFVSALVACGLACAILLVIERWMPPMHGG